MVNAVRGIEKRGPVAGQASSPMRSQNANRSAAQHNQAASPQVFQSSQYGGMSYSLRTVENDHLKVFNHLCTVDGDGQGSTEQAHRNTITSICVVASTAPGSRARVNSAGFDVATERSPGGAVAQLNLQYQVIKKVFTCSLDSTIKCWNFSGSAPSIMASSQAHPNYQSQSANMGIFDQNQQPIYSVQSQHGHPQVVQSNA